MLQIQHISKVYHTGKLSHPALKDVSLNFRDSEFTAILGPSGSGKTTLLNIIGGLDHYDEGDLIINGISTKQYTDRDWDSYRNHSIGFVFQSYNLIPHQTVLSNVELALTIAGLDKQERRRRAKEALCQVGLGEHMYKLPNQLSGGQAQRVAIARSLVNDPDILLADEPTGALDSETSVQVMDLLREVAADRLVVMVTHNPELARNYATRIVNLKDGRIASDSMPYVPDERETKPPVHKNMGHASMRFFTSLALSFNNLRTKKARTLLTSFAGSIGIIGISLILSISNGVNDYIDSQEQAMLEQYPLTVSASTFNITSMLTSYGSTNSDEEGVVSVMQSVSSMFSTVEENDLASLKEYIDSGESGMEEYVRAIEYLYSVSPQIYLETDDGVRQVHPDSSFSALGIGSTSSSSSIFSSLMSTDVFYELPENSELYESQYDLAAGEWPDEYNECVLVLNEDGSMSDFLLYTLGLRDFEELDELIAQFADGESASMPEDLGTYEYEEILGTTFKLVNSADYYTYDETYEVWKSKADDEEYIGQLVSDGEEITIVGIVIPNTDMALLSSGIYYPYALTMHVIGEAAESEIVQAQLADPDTNVFTGEAFGESSEEEFDLSEMFSVDEDALAEAFVFDEEALTLSLDLSDSFDVDTDSLDLSGLMDLSDLSVDSADVGSPDLSGVMSSLDFSLSSAEMSELASALMEGYQAYAAENPEADYSNLSADFSAYLSSDEAGQIIADNISLTDLIGSDGNISVSEEQMSTISAALLAGYSEYAAANGLADPDKIDDYFIDYLGTDAAQAIITEAMISAIDTTAIESAVAAAVEAYVQQAMTAYASVLSESISAQMETAMSSVLSQLMAQVSAGLESTMADAMADLASSLGQSVSIDADAFAEAFEFTEDTDELVELMTSLSTSSTATYESNLEDMGYADLAAPEEIDIYTADFDKKDAVAAILDDYNEQMEAAGTEEKAVEYTDTVGTLMSSVTQIINIVSYALIAFVGVSLVVSSIMIGVITYISVLERKKEIGILRALGASKRNVSQVFNAETCIIGLCSGLMGVIIAALVLIPLNFLFHTLTDITDVSAVLKLSNAAVLAAISVGLTMFAGLIPSRKAAKNDPVEALRTE